MEEGRWRTRFAQRIKEIKLDERLGQVLEGMARLNEEQTRIR